MSNPKKICGDGHSDSPLDSFLEAWNRHMDGYKVGKYSQELDNAQAKTSKRGSCDEEKS